MSEAFATSTPAGRVESLDYLRGLLAVAVMVYHYVSWAGYHPGAGTLLGRLGIYAVSTFYVLSGLSLALVYRHRLAGVDAVTQYAIHRVFRIVPLFWVAVTASLTLQVLPRLLGGEGLPELDLWRIFLNYSLLFGFVQPDAYFSTGAWSIGNEMVFYAIFPLLIAAWSRGWALLALCFIASLAIAGSLTAGITATRPLSDQWATYINPFNQLPFFIAGIVIAYLGGVREKRDGWLGLLLMAAGAVMFTSVGLQGDSSVLVTLGSRSYFFIACLLFVAGVYRANHLLARMPLAGGLGRLGAWTYSIYLLHPFAPVVTTRLVGEGWLGYTVAAIGTLFVSSASYRWLELPMMRWGKQLALKRVATGRAVESAT